MNFVTGFFLVVLPPTIMASGGTVGNIDLSRIRATRDILGDKIVQTPVWEWQDQTIRDRLGVGTRVFLKLELFQHTGTFKSRGALVNVLGLDAEARAKGVTAVSAGNHAIAVSFCASLVGSHAKVVMPKTANPFRVSTCRRYGAQVVLVDDVKQAFDEVARIEREESRFYVHPFNSEPTILGTATLGMEWIEQCPDLEAIIVPVGGGGLCAGVSTAIKLQHPNCEIFGVEPVGADTMHRAFQAGTPQPIEKVATIADSLGPPSALPFSFEICQRYVDDLVRIEDDDMRDAMRLLFHSMKLAVEPAGAAATAALCGPLRERLAGKRVGVLVCGTNIDAESFARLVVT